MTSVDPRIHPSQVPDGSRAIVIAEHQQDKYNALPSVVSPRGMVITRWELTQEERIAVFAGADIFLTIWGTPIRPVHLNVGPWDWRDAEKMGG